MSTANAPTDRAMARLMWLGQMRIAGYHGDTAAHTRLLIEAKMNRAELEMAWRAGVVLKEEGMQCGCQDCIAERQQAQGAAHG